MAELLQVSREEVARSRRPPKTPVIYELTKGGAIYGPFVGLVGGLTARGDQRKQQAGSSLAATTSAASLRGQAFFVSKRPNVPSLAIGVNWVRPRPLICALLHTL
jgi:hypothetical protein